MKPLNLRPLVGWAGLFANLNNRRLPAYYRNRRAYDVEASSLAVLKRERKKGKAALDAARRRRGAKCALDEIQFPWIDMGKGITYPQGLEYQGRRPIRVRRAKRAIAVPIIVDDFGGYPNV